VPVIKLPIEVEAELTLTKFGELGPLTNDHVPVPEVGVLAAAIRDVPQIF